MFIWVSFMTAIVGLVGLPTFLSPPFSVSHFFALDVALSGTLAHTDHFIFTFSQSSTCLHHIPLLGKRPYL